MNNLKVSLKLVIAFLIVAGLTLIVGIFGIYGMTRMDNAANDMYANQATPLGDLLTATDYFQRLRVQVRNAIIYSGKAENLSTVDFEMNDRMSKFEAAMQAYKPSLASEKGTQLYNNVMNAYNDSFKPGILAVLEGAKRGEPSEQLLESMASTTLAANQIAIDLSDLGQARLGVMESADKANGALGSALLVVILVAIAGAIVVSIILALYISKMISGPIAALTAFMNLAGSDGDISISNEEQAVFDKYGQNKDEIGQCMASTVKFIRHVTLIGKELEEIAGGDLRTDIKLLSKKDGMGLSLQKMTESLNAMFAEINQATVQVSAGSKQIADGSQRLAQGSTEQAASIQELSSSISSIAQNTKENAEMALRAANMANSIKLSAEKGSGQMDHMMEAVKEINQASQSINKVIKVIDDIAFQTNILALNAAVEAARAGQHGKGFAVVAEEVRNLAAKSAAAAKDTGGLIANSMEKAELGARIAEETAASLGEIVSGINESSQLVSEIAQSSEQQSESINQLNKGIDQVAQVVQQNSATAEESAAASQEMSGQSTVLEGLIRQFKLKDNGNAAYSQLQSAQQTVRHNFPAAMEMENSSYDSYGKY